ncbi:MAG: efflux RND transporter periplasmic adaptor subunit [Phycisphaerales bacterium]|jgi:membrane fusion protein (multidrug efflux system)
MSEKSPETEKNSIKGWLRRNATKAIIIVVAILVVTIISKLPNRKQDTTPPAEIPVNVTVMNVVSQSRLADTFDLPAVVEPNRIITVSAEIAGRIEQIPLKEGSMVNSGDLLIQLNSDLVRPEFDMAEAQAKRDKLEYDRIVNLVKENATPQRDLDDAATRLAISKATLEEVRARLDRTRILASTKGTLNELFVEEGEYVQAGTAVAELVDTDTVKVVVEVPERDIGFFTIGRQADIFVDIKGQTNSLTGTISFINKLADPRTRSTRAEITLINKDQLLRSGQIVRARLMRRTLNNTIMIPLLAVIPMENNKAVYVVNSDMAVRREVELGIIKGDRVQITRGLEPGDRLIIDGNRFVAPDQKVNIISENK